jgi:putative ABC transport system permease protein
MDTLVHDIRYGFRVLRKAPGVSAVIILIVAVGVGAACTIFSIVESSLLWSENPNVDRWIMLRAFFPRQNMRVFSFTSGEYFDARGLTDVFERVGAVHGINATLFVEDSPELIEETFLTADMIPMTATAPLLGRVFSERDDTPGAPKTTVLTYELWQHYFGGDRNILGKSLRIDEEHYTVIGVMPPHYTLWGGALYVPFQLDPADTDRSNRRMRVVALVRPGVTMDQAGARLDGFARTLARDHGSTNPEYQGMQLTTWNIREAIVGGVRPVLLILMAVVGLIVVISCANIGNLLLARASARRREMVVRAALGAPRRRILRQLLTESLLLSLTGGALGILLAEWGVPAAVALIGESQLPNAAYARLDGGALLLAVAVSVVMGFVFGIAPAVYMVRGDLACAIREAALQAGGNRYERWTRAALVVSQIALSMVVLAGAGLMLRTYGELLRLDVGYNAHNALMAQLVLPAEKYSTPQKIAAFYADLLERLRASSGVQGAAVATGRPMLDRVTDVSTQDFSLPGRGDDKSTPNANVRAVTAGYFDVVGMRVIRGRLFTDADTPLTEPVAVINHTMARLYWPRQDAVGQRVRLATLYSNGAGAAPGSRSEEGAIRSQEVTIVGVVSDARQLRVIDIPVRQEIFFPIAQRPEMTRAVTLIVRSPLPTDQVTTTMRRAVTAIDPDRPVFDVITLEQAVSDSFATKRLATVLLGFFAAVAMTLASVGLYAIVAYSVSLRTREIGIRMALGARPRDVLALTLTEGWQLAAAGLAAGIVAAWLSTGVMRSLVFDVSTTDPLTFVLAGGLLAAIGLLASYVPARRATRIDPTVALRCE